MKFTNPFRRQLASTDAMLSARPGRKSSLCAT
jgi:hypothetical protein